MYDHQFELDRINDMDERQILLKVKNLKHFGFMTREQFNEIKSAIDKRLNTYNYELVPACCGRFNVAKINKE
jgi:DnaJ-domain-containing protein 1